MSFVLRTISKAKWFPLATCQSAVHEGGEAELQADALSDIRTEGNKLSVWYIDDNRSNLDRVLTALAANRDIVSHVDYVILKEDSVRALNILIEESDGGSPDKDVNKWHRDLNIGSSNKLFALAGAIFSNGDSRVRKPKKEVEQMLCKAVQAGSIDAKLLKPSVKQVIERATQTTL